MNVGMSTRWTALESQLSPMSNVSFIYHVNFNHLSLSLSQREDYIENFDYLIKKITFPATLSIFGEDLLFLSLKNPKAIQAIKENYYVRLFIPEYTHMLPYMFEEFLELQINLGKKMVEHLGLSAKMNNIFYSSEVDYLSPKIWTNLPNLISGMVVGETKVKIDGINESDYPSYLPSSFNNTQMPIYITRRKFEYREQLHKFLRDEIDAGEMNSALLSDIENYGKLSPLIARIDLEILVFNSISDSKATLHNRIDKWAKYMDELKAISVVPIFTEEISKIANCKFTCLDECCVSRNTVEDRRWNNEDLLKALRRVDYFKLSAFQKTVFLSLMCSDYFCSNLKDFVFDTYYGKLIICKTRKYRDLESILKMCILQNKTTTPKDKLLSNYINAFMEVAEKAKELL